MNTLTIKKVLSYGLIIFHILGFTAIILSALRTGESLTAKKDKEEENKTASGHYTNEGKRARLIISLK